MYIADSGNDRIRKVDTEGVITTISGTICNPNLYKIGVGGIAIDQYDNIYYAGSYYCNQVRKIDRYGEVTVVAGAGGLAFGGDGGQATDAYLDIPSDVAVDRYGNLYIADTRNQRIRKVSPEGIISTVAGGGFAENGQATQVQLGNVKGVEIDAEGNLYITENSKLRKVDTNGIMSTIVGTNAIASLGDNGLASNARLSSPRGIDIDIYGNLLISDGGHYRIRKIALSTQFEAYNLSLGESLYKHQNNTADIFDATGKHLKTIDLNTGNALKTFTYDENNHLLSITNRFNQTTTITRDANGHPTQITAPNGQVTTLTVDENNNLTQVSYEDNSKYEFSYFDGSLMDTMIDPNGNVISHVWNDTGRIVEEVDGLGGSYRFLRNVNGDETFYSTILPEGETSTSSDVTLANGDTQSTMTLATGETVTATFANDESSTTSLRDGVSSVSTYTTDTLTHQRILASTQTTQPSNLKNTSTYSTTYDGNETHTNTKTQTITSNTKTTILVTNYNNGTSSIMTPTGRTSTSTYDVNTLLTSQNTSGTLTPTTYMYDNKGRVTQERTGTREITYTYDAKGNLATLTNERGQTTSYGYDSVDNLTTVTYPNNTTEHFTYDNNGNLLTRTVPTPAEHTFTYNGADLRVSNTSPLQKSTTYNYDKSKNLTTIHKPSAKTIVNTYTKGRLDSTQTNEGTTNYTYLFANKVGSITKDNESFTFTYDGTLLTSTTQSGVLNHTTNFTYNNDFQVASSTYAGATESYTYDDDGLLTSSGDYTLTRDAQNAYTTNLTDGTLTQNRSYNNFGEVTEVADNTFTYQLSQRDNAGAITQKKETLNGATNTYDYTFDDMGRLTNVTKDNQEVETYTYDANGNRASATVHGTSISASYTLDDSLVVYGDNTYLYDEDGYLQTKTTPEGSTTYNYGTLGELRQVTTPTKTISYQHNANNQRVAKLVDGTVTEKYLWANLTTLLAIYDSNDNLVQRFEYADSRMPVAMTMEATKYYLHYDQVGSLRAVSDDSHNIVKEISYDTYGNVLTDSNEAFRVPFGFAGGLYDADTKLTRFGYRDYDATTGKWTAKDPIGFSGGDSNLYGYVLGDPVNFTDSRGLDWLNDLANYSAGFGDTLTFGLTKEFRKVYGYDNAVNPCSENYTDGEYSAILVALLGSGGSASGLSLSINVYKHGGFGLNIYSKYRKFGNGRLYGLDKHPFKYNGNSKTRWHQHYGKNASQMKKHRPFFWSRW